MASKEKDVYDEINSYLKDYLSSIIDVAEKAYDTTSKEFQQKAKALETKAIQYNIQIANRLEKYGARETLKSSKDLFDRIKNMNLNHNNTYNKTAVNAGRNADFFKHAGKIADGVVVAKTAYDLQKALDTATKTGDYDVLAKAGVEAVGTLLGAWAAAAILSAIGISAAAPLTAFLIAVSIVAVTAYVTEKGAELAWEYIFEPWIPAARDWLSDKFSDWFNLKRSGLTSTPHYDPLVLDLDGDGIELVNANGSNGVQFDLNGNGIKTATQWVKPDDGLLVWDRNGNGVIDNGTELFGQDMPKKWITQPVTDGFSALKTINDHPDGEINAKDSEWKNLKVWRDLNQDGETQKGELFTLDKLGITALSLSAQNGVSTFTYQDGKKNKLADVNFSIDTIHSEYKEHIAIGETQLKLPNLHGVGMLRDLREAVNNEFFAQYTTAFQAA